DLLLEDLLAHLEVGDAVEEHAARLGPSLEDRALVAAPLEVLGDGEAGRPGANDGAGVTRAGGLGFGHRESAVTLALLIGEERLESADGDGRVLDAVGPDGEADDAGALAEVLLRAEASAHLRQRRGLAELVGCRLHLATLEQFEG